MNVRTKGIMIAVVAAAVGGLAALGSGRALAQETFAGSFPFQGGKALYQHICQGCHMPDGQGAVGAGRYPAFAGDHALGSSSYVLRTVLHGFGDMPPFSQDLDDAQIANVANYIRTHFGNHFEPAITAAEVKAMRPSAANTVDTGD